MQHHPRALAYIARCASRSSVMRDVGGYGAAKPLRTNVFLILLHWARALITTFLKSVAVSYWHEMHTAPHTFVGTDN